MKKEHAQESYRDVQGEGRASGHRQRETVTELAQRYQLHPSQITAWNAQLVERVPRGVGAEAAEPKRSSIVKELHAKIGQLAMEKDLPGALGKAGMPSAKR